MARTAPQDPKGNTIKEFIERKSLYIPSFQRRYDWGNDEVMALWGDLTEHVLHMKSHNPQRVHYFGNSILYANDGRLDLIDGQQRTLTFVALIAAFRDFFKAHGMDDDWRDARELLWDRHEERPFIHSSNALDEASLRELVDPNFECNAMGPSLARLHKSYCWLLTAIEEAYQAEVDFQRDEVKAKKKATKWYLDILDHSHVSSVTCDSLNEAFIMFKAHNSRGKDLDASDLVKVALMEFFTARTIDEARFMGLWGNFDTRCQQKPQEIGYMLGDYYKAKTGRMISSSGLISHWEEMLSPLNRSSSTGEKIFKELDNFSEEWSEWKYKRADDGRHNDLVDMRVSNQFAPLLAAWKATGSNTVLAKGHRKVLYSCIEFVHIHAKLAGMEDANSLKKAYVRWAHLMWKTGNSADALQEIKQSARTFKSAGRETFRNNLRHRNDLTTAQSRFLLRKIEEYKTPGLTANEMNHVEHITPKAYASEQAWDHIKWDEHSSKLNNLGNLTLLLDKSNMSIGNKGWAIKAPVFAASDLKLNKEITAKGHTAWTTAIIKERCNDLANYLYDNLKLLGD